MFLVVSLATRYRLIFLATPPFALILFQLLLTLATPPFAFIVPPLAATATALKLFFPQVDYVLGLGRCSGKTHVSTHVSTHV